MTLRYAQIALGSWEDVDGYAVGHGLADPREMPMDRFCNFVWFLSTRNAETEADVTKFRARLWRPPVGVRVTDKRSPWSPESETASLRALKASLGGGAQPTPTGQAT